MNNDLFGAPSGKIDGSMPEGLRNSYDYIPDRSIAEMAQSDRIEPRQVATGVTRGTWRISDTDGSYITIGIIPDTNGEFGIAFFDESGNLIQKIVRGTTSVYNPADDYKNVTQSGLLPDGSGGFVVANEGSEVEDVFA